MRTDGATAAAAVAARALATTMCLFASISVSIIASQERAPPLPVAAIEQGSTPWRRIVQLMSCGSFAFWIERVLLTIWAVTSVALHSLARYEHKIQHSRRIWRSL